MVRKTCFGIGMLFLAQVAGAQFTQQGSKLVGTGAAGPARQGSSVAISADGNTAILGGPADNSNAGAVWVFTRSGGAWAQQGTKLVGDGCRRGRRKQGRSVAISADGNTAIVGGLDDDSGEGAAWVFTRTGGVWSQQGAKLVGTGGAFGGADQGTSVAISADGNTAIVGGQTSTTPMQGAAWVFTRTRRGVVAAGRSWSARVPSAQATGHLSGDLLGRQHRHRRRTARQL